MTPKPIVSFYHRRLSNEELADLPLDNWHNVIIDESKYTVSFLKAWEMGTELLLPEPAAATEEEGRRGTRYVGFFGNPL